MNCITIINDKLYSLGLINKEEKGRDLTQSYDKQLLIINIMHSQSICNTNTLKPFDYTTIADRQSQMLRQQSYRTDVVSPRSKGQTFQLPVRVVQFKGQTFRSV